MGRCVVVIEQRHIPENIGGILITSHDTELDYFTLHIVINSGLCDKSSLNNRARQKITVVHEFTHTVAALSAISRVRSKELVKRLTDILELFDNFSYRTTSIKIRQFRSHKARNCKT
jgi:hypothetical protein